MSNTDLKLYRVISSIKKALQYQGKDAFTQVSKVLAGTPEKAKEIKENSNNERQVAHSRSSSLALTEQDQGMLKEFIEKSKDGSIKFKNVVALESCDDEDCDKLMRTSMKFDKNGAGKMIIEQLRGNFNLYKLDAYTNGKMTKEELFNELKDSSEKYCDPNDMYRNYSKLVASLDENNNFSISTSSGQRHYFTSIF